MSVILRTLKQNSQMNFISRGCVCVTSKNSTQLLHWHFYTIVVYEVHLENRESKLNLETGNCRAFILKMSKANSVSLMAKLGLISVGKITP